MFTRCLHFHMIYIKYTTCILCSHYICYLHTINIYLYIYLCDVSLLLLFILRFLNQNVGPECLINNHLNTGAVGIFVYWQRLVSKWILITSANIFSPHWSKTKKISFGTFQCYDAIHLAVFSFWKPYAFFPMEVLSSFLPYLRLEERWNLLTCTVRITCC